MQEYHKICECPQDSSSVSESHPYATPTLSFNRPEAGVALPSCLPIGPQSGRCGVVPIPAPLVFMNRREVGQNEGEQEVDETQASDALVLSLPTPRTNVVDYSMTNAWFPGYLGGVSFVKLPTTTTGDGRRDKIICAVNFQAPDIRSVLSRPEESECLALGGRRRQQGQEKMNAYVYETYDPEKMSMHRGLGMGDSISGAGTNNTFTSTSSNNDHTNDDPNKCQRCLQREALIRLERKKAEHRSKMMLDRGLRAYGSSGGYNWDEDDEYDDDGDEDEDEDDEDDDDDMDMDETGDDEMIDVDVDELGIDVDRIIAEATSISGSTGSMQVDDPQITSFGDDDPGLHWDQMRGCYDRCRIGVECRGVGDILLSGEAGFLSLFLMLLCY